MHNNIVPREIQSTLLKWHVFGQNLFFEGIFVGLLAGIIVVAFRFALEETELVRKIIYKYLISGQITLIMIWFSGLLFIGILLGLIMRYEPMSGGSGIPQVKGAILGLVNMTWFKILFAKFLGGVLAIGAGMSLGREGPSIQMGAVVGQGVSRTFGRTIMEEKYLLTCGASAGLAAAFNAPLAGIIFSLEELHKKISPAILISAAASSLTADLVTRYFYGREPFWNLAEVPFLPFNYYGLLAMLGVITGTFGVFFNRCLIKSLDIYANQWLIPKNFQAIVPLIIGGMVGFILPEILGGGNALIDTICIGHYDLSLLLILLIGKFLFTMASYGSGVPGGIFLPMLVIGALIGENFSSGITLLGFEYNYHTTFVVLAMAAYFTAIVKAPITGTVLIAEMTGSFGHLVEIMIICMVAYVTADIGKSRPIYDILLERSLQQGVTDSNKSVRRQQPNSLFALNRK